MLEKKIQRIQKQLRKEGLDALVIGNFGHQIRDDLLYYLLLTHLELGMLIVPKKGKPTLFAISFEVAQLRKTYKALRVVPFDKKPSVLFRSHMKKDGLMVGYNPTSLPSGVFSSLKRTPRVSLKQFHGVKRIPSIKLPQEARLLKKAAEYTDDIFALLVKKFHTFATESDAAQFILNETCARGLEPSFPPIVASGKHAADPHHHPQPKKIQKGFCVIDMGVRYKGYCSDMTRTLYIGKPKRAEQDLYDILLRVQKETVAQVKPGVTTAALDYACRKALGPGLSSQFIHSLGHGLGTQVHEWPSVSGASDTTLEAGMLITIEPGVYAPGRYGIRIEDDVLVTAKGHAVLNRSAKTLQIVSK